MTEQCKGDGSIQKLVTNKWKTVGVGQLILLKNTHNPTFILLKLIRKKKNQIFMFQCKPKVKTNGKALILKGTETKKKQEFVLSIRFKDSDTMNQFENVFNDLYQKIQRNVFKSKHKRTASTPPQTLKLQLLQYAWDCELCTFRNEPTTFDCEICKHPRPLKPALDAKRSSGHSNQDSWAIDTLPPMESPVMSGTDSHSIGPVGYDNIDNYGDNSLKQLHIISENVYTDEKDESKDESKSESKHNSYSNNDNNIEEEDDQKSTIKELIIKIINGEEVSSIKSSTVEDILLLCHNVFTDSETMLKTLLNLLCDKNLGTSSTRIRGVNMCERWIKKYWIDDFENNEPMENIMYNFIDNLADLDLPDSDMSLLERIRKVFEDQTNRSEIIKKRTSTIRAAAKILDMAKDYNIMAQSTQHIAEQITLMHFKIFSSIQKREMCGQAWKKKDKDFRAPHLLDMIRQFNSISKWVQCVVLQQRNKTERKRCIEKFIRVAVQLRELRNFSSCCAINFGLSGNVIYKLKATWQCVGRKEMKQYNEIQMIFKGQKNWELLRVLHKNAHAPSILHTGLFLQDLLNTDEGNTDKKKDGTVNFTKLKQTYLLIEQVCMYQNSQYFKIKKDNVFQGNLNDIWLKQEAYNENKMWDIMKVVREKDSKNENIEDNDLALFAW